MRVDEANAREIVAGFDVVIDGSDNFDTRYAVSDACYFARKPLVTAAIGEFDGTLTTLKPYEAGADGAPNPTYRCLFPEAPPPGTVPACAEAGVLGALGGVLGSLMALEAIREIVGGFGEGDAGLVGTPVDDRCARDALRNAALCVGRGKSAERPAREGARRVVRRSYVSIRPPRSPEDAPLSAPCGAAR